MTAYQIKPLEWEEGNGGKNWQAETPFMRLTVWEYGEYCWWAIDLLGPAKPCYSIEDGKAKAEAYYRERLLAALVPVPTFFHHDEAVHGCAATPAQAARNPNPEGRT